MPLLCLHASSLPPCLFPASIPLLCLHVGQKDNMGPTIRGREENNVSPVVHIGMRHFPQKSCEMAGLIGQAAMDGSAGGVPRMMNSVRLMTCDDV